MTFTLLDWCAIIAYLLIALLLGLDFRRSAGRSSEDYTVWILVTLFTAPEPNSILLSFYRRVRPDVTGWKTIAALAPEVTATHDLGRNLRCWILGTVIVYSALFGVGKLLIQKWGVGICLTTLAALCACQMSRDLSHGHGSTVRTA
jgi:hypothetical protein